MLMHTAVEKKIIQLQLSTGYLDTRTPNNKDKYQRQCFFMK